MNIMKIIPIVMKMSYVIANFTHLIFVSNQINNFFSFSHSQLSQIHLIKHIDDGIGYVRGDIYSS